MVLSLRSNYILKSEYSHALEVETAIKRFTQYDDLIVSSRSLYYTQRSGWVLSLDLGCFSNEIIEELKSYEDQGVRHVLVSN